MKLKWIDIDEKFMCQCCGETFESDNGMLESLAIMKEDFTPEELEEQKDDEMAVICDDCYKVIINWHKERRDKK